MFCIMASSKPSKNLAPAPDASEWLRIEVKTPLGNSPYLVAFKDNLMFQARDNKRAALAEEIAKEEYLVFKPTENPLVYQTVDEEEWEYKFLFIFSCKLSDGRYTFKTKGTFAVGDTTAFYVISGVGVTPGWEEPANQIVSVTADW